MSLSKSYSQRVSSMLDAIVSGYFNEHSVRSLILDVRSFAPRNSLLREIGDFFAHPEKRDRGIIHARVLGTSVDLKRYFDILRGRTHGDRTEVEIRLCFKAEEVVDSLCSILVRSGLVIAPDQRLMHLFAKRSELALCIMVLLQGAVFEIDALRATSFLAESHDHTVALMIVFRGEDLGAKEGIGIGFPVIQSDYPWCAHAPKGIEGIPPRTYFKLTRDTVRGFFLLADLPSTQVAQ